MKKIIAFTFILSVVLIGNSCKKAKKDYNEYLPVIKLVSAVVQSDGSVLVTGQMDSEGESKIDYIGFCCSTNNTPTMPERQVLATSGSTFTANIKNLNVDSAYYFRAFATNSFGYSYSNIIYLNSVVPPAVTVPCTLTANTVNLGDGTGTTTATSSNLISYDNFSGYYSFTAYMASSNPISFTFGSHITNGTFTTGSNEPASNEVYVTFTNFNMYAVGPGASVYVNTISPGVYDVTICDGSWSTGFSTNHLSARLTAHN